MNLFMKQKSARRVAREKVLQVLYALEMNNEGLEALTGSMFAEIDRQEVRNFADDLVNKVRIYRAYLDDLIVKRVSNWELERIAAIDRILIKMGMAEIIYFPDIPPKVTINEIIDIAKQYSTPVSGKFVNGILDKFLEDYTNEGKLKKTGRGLLTEKLKKNS